MILVLDNYDSFVHNLARYVRELGGEPEVHRNDTLSLSDIRALAPTHIIISPGPCTPAESGIAVDVVRELGATTPILGVCLGHQCIAAAYGGRIVASPHPQHGRAGVIIHEGAGVLDGLPSPFMAGRYHSLVVDRPSLPPTLAVTATAPDGTIMGLRHREFPVHGVQFHPESVLTEHGHGLLHNFLQMGERPERLVSRPG